MNFVVLPHGLCRVVPSHRTMSVGALEDGRERLGDSTLGEDWKTRQIKQHKQTNEQNNTIIGEITFVITSIPGAEAYIMIR